MEFRLFVDEVGNGDLRAAAADPNSRYLSLTGYLTVLSTHDNYIQGHLDEMKSEIFGHTPEKPVILHRREIVRREGAFVCLHNPETSQKFSDWLLKFLQETPCLVFTVQIDKQAHAKKYLVWTHDPYHYCMQCLMERYVQWLAWHNFQGDVCIEARGKEPDRKLQASYERLYNRGTNYVKDIVFKKFLKTKKAQLRPKRDNIAGLQIADLIAHPSARYMRHVIEKRDMPEDFGSQIVRILIEKRYYRNRDTNVIEGTGLKWLP